MTLQQLLFIFTSFIGYFNLLVQSTAESLLRSSASSSCSPHTGSRGSVKLYGHWSASHWMAFPVVLQGPQGGWAATQLVSAAKICH